MSRKVGPRFIILFTIVFAITAGLDFAGKSLHSKWIRPRRYILGGLEAPAHKFPYLIFIQVPVPDTEGYNGCGGSIIQHESDPIRYKILTAAHCFDELIESKKPGVKDTVITLGMGVNNLVAEQDKAEIVEVKFRDIIIHPAYDARTNDHDLAIIPLPADFKLVPGSIETVALAPASDKDRNYAGLVIEAAGWGDTSPGPSGHGSEQLLYLTSTILSDEACKAAIKPELHVPMQYNKNFLCIDGKGNKGTCHGDSGGPLVDVSAKLVVGVASFRLIPECKGETPSYFIRVVKYLPWISKTI